MENILFLEDLTKVYECFDKIEQCIWDHHFSNKYKNDKFTLKDLGKICWPEPVTAVAVHNKIKKIRKMIEEALFGIDDVN